MGVRLDPSPNVVGINPTGVKTANYAAYPGEMVPVDATSGAVTVTLPNAPFDGAEVGVKRVAGLNTVTINCQGSDVFNVAGGVTAATITITNQMLNFRYDAGTHIWYVETNMSLGGLDARYHSLVTEGRRPWSKIPQLEDVAIHLFGHSLAALIGTAYYTTGRHWSVVLSETNVGSVTNRAVAGRKMELLAVDMSTAATAWPFDANKKLCLVMCVANSAGAEITAQQAKHRAAFTNAIETIASMVLSDHIADTATANMVYSGTWTAQGLASYIGASGVYTQSPGASVTYTVPAGVTNKRIWAHFIDGDYAQTTFAPVTITRTGAGGSSPVGTAIPMNTTYNPASFSKKSIDCGRFSTGDTLTIAHAGTGAQTLFFDGLLQENGKNHVCFTEDSPDFLQTGATEWTQWPGTGFDGTRLAAYNQLLRDQVASINSRVTNAASTLVMQDTLPGQPYMSPLTATWQDYYTATDHIHPNDRGHMYYAAKITQELAAKIPWTARLHSVITHE